GGTIVTAPPLATAGTVTVALQQGVNYRIFAVAQADSTVNAGLFGATVSPVGGGSPAYSKVVPVGTVSPIDSLSLTSGASYTFQLTDLAYPTPLMQLGGVVVSDGQADAAR